jgi:hypothetical protein
VNPIVQKLGEALHSSAAVSKPEIIIYDSHLYSFLPLQLPDEARMLAIQQLDTLSGVAKGLTRLADGILIFFDRDQEEEQNGQLELIHRARDDLRMIKLREQIFGALRVVVELWSTDAEVAAVRFLISSAAPF